MTQNEVSILNGQSLADYSVTYYLDSGFVNQILTPTIYVNTNPLETIYVKIATIGNQDCYISTAFEIEVFKSVT